MTAAGGFLKAAIATAHSCFNSSDILPCGFPAMFKKY